MPALAIVILVAAGFAFGLAFGRWWALVAGGIFGIWVASAWEVPEVPSELMGVILGGIATAGIALGVGARKRSDRAAREESPGG